MSENTPVKKGRPISTKWNAMYQIRLTKEQHEHIIRNGGADYLRSVIQREIDITKK